MEDEEAVVVRHSGGADDHRPEKVDPPVIDTDENRIGEILLEDLPVLQHDLGFEIVVIGIVGNDVESAELVFVSLLILLRLDP